MFNVCRTGKLTAKKENRPIETGANGKWDVKTACQQACPTSAIVFGNVNDKNSPITQVREGQQKNRVFYALEQLHVLPSVNYLAKIRNTDREVGLAIVEASTWWTTGAAEASALGKWEDVQGVRSNLRISHLDNIPIK